MGTIEPSGNTWEIPEINFNLWPEGEYEIKLEGCDESGICAIILFDVNNSHLYVEELIQPISQDSNEERSIPFTNLYLILISIAGALMYTTRRD